MMFRELRAKLDQRISLNAKTALGKVAQKGEEIFEVTVSLGQALSADW